MRIGIIGCTGRMGRTLIQEVLNNSKAKLSGGSERAGNQFIGHDIGEVIGIGKTGFKVNDDNESLVKSSDAVIDFTTPENSLGIAELCAKYKKAHIIGTTGFSEKQKAELQKHAKKAAILLSPNMSIGVNVVMDIAEKLAALLDETYDIEIVEMHHNKKVDAPSGTALGLGHAVARGRGVKLEKKWQKVRDGVTGARKAGDIGFATLRGGDVAGDHTVMFAADGERVELTHKASNRSVFAKGAVRAAIWAKGKKPGFYSMKDVIKG